MAKIENIQSKHMQEYDVHLNMFLMYLNYVSEYCICNSVGQKCLCPKYTSTKTLLSKNEVQSKHRAHKPSLFI